MIGAVQVPLASFVNAKENQPIRPIDENYVKKEVTQIVSSLLIGRDVPLPPAYG